jgi:hypothetical protein
MKEMVDKMDVLWESKVRHTHDSWAYGQDLD